MSQAMPTVEDIQNDLEKHRKSLVEAKKLKSEWEQLEKNAVYKKLVLKWFEALEKEGIEAISDPNVKDEAVKLLTVVSMFKNHRNAVDQRIEELNVLIPQHEQYINMISGEDDE